MTSAGGERQDDGQREPHSTLDNERIDAEKLNANPKNFRSFFLLLLLLLTGQLATQRNAAHSTFPRVPHPTATEASRSHDCVPFQAPADIHANGPSHVDAVETPQVSILLGRGWMRHATASIKVRHLCCCVGLQK
mgnify:FL=1